MKTIITTLALLLYIAGNAQECGTDFLHKELMSKDSVYADFQERDKLNWTEHLKKRENALIIETPNGPVYEIPVVVHVIHCGEPVGAVTNPSDNEIMDWIADCNQAFAAEGAYADTNSGGVYIPLKLVLAKRTPTCDSTNGIVRVSGIGLTNYVYSGVRYGGPSGPSDSEVKSLSHWPSKQYYNIYVVRYIDGASGGYAAGYAYYPGASDLLDGTVVASKYVTYKLNGNYWPVLSHEIGHAFGLRHTFNGDNGSCPLNNNCATDGDGVCDTEPHRQPTGCPSGVNTCTGSVYNNIQYNIMNYTDCKDRFTEGQKTKVLYNLMFYRESLLYSLGVLSPASSMVNVKKSCVVSQISYPTNQMNLGPRLISLAGLKLISDGYNGDGTAYKDWNVDSCGVGNPTAKLLKNGTYSLSVKVGPNEENIGGWIDFDNDGIFTNAEKILDKYGQVANETFSQSFTVPGNAGTCTPVRVRIMSDDAYYPEPEMCNGLFYGQTEDFSVIIESTFDPASVSISSSVNDSICAGDSIIFTATAIGGVPLKYSWKKNGLHVGTGKVIKLSDFRDSDTISCILEYRLSCDSSADTTGNNIIMRVKPVLLPSVSVLSDFPDIVCSGTKITFTATALGNNLSYNWILNDSTVGTDDSTYTTTGIQHQDTIYCMVTGFDPVCAVSVSKLSNKVIMSVKDLVSPAVTISADSGLNLSPGQAVQFSANTTDIGSNPIFQWRRNGIDISGANADIYQATAGTDVQHNDELSLYVKNTDPCAQPDTAISNVLKLSVIKPTSIAGTNKMHPVLLFPNPNNGTFQISATGMGEDNSTLQLRIYDIMGKEIFAEGIELISGNSDHRIQLSEELPSGTYLLKIKGNQFYKQLIFVVK